MQNFKQRTPAATGDADRKQNNGNLNPIRSISCRQCAFFELIIKQGGYKKRRGFTYGLCHLTGKRDPQPGQNGCHFLPGQWENIDLLLGLTPHKVKGKLNFPNCTRHGKRLFSIPNTDKQIADNITAIHSPAGISGREMKHIGRVARSSIREDWRLRTGRGALHPAFLF